MAEAPRCFYLVAAISRRRAIIALLLLLWRAVITLWWTIIALLLRWTVITLPWRRAIITLLLRRTIVSGRWRRRRRRWTDSGAQNRERQSGDGCRAHDDAADQSQHRTGTAMIITVVTPIRRSGRTRRRQNGDRKARRDQSFAHNSIPQT